MFKHAFFLILTLTSVSAWAQQVYKWTDAQGKVHYSDIPPQNAINLTQKNVAGSIIETDSLPAATKLAAEKNPIILYSFSDCGAPCSQGEAMLKERGIPYTLKSSVDDKMELKKLTGKLQAPVLIIGKRQPITGFEAFTWDDALDTAGYPRSNPLKDLKRTPAGGTKPPPSAAPEVPASAPAPAPSAPLN